MSCSKKDYNYENVFYFPIETMAADNEELGDISMIKY